jgi:hypothetical protein
MKIPQPIFRYWLAMNATAMQSAIHAVKIYCGVAGWHEVIPATLPSLQVAALDLKQGAMVFGIAFGSAILNYLDANPLPVPSGTATAATAASGKVGQ